MKFRAFSQPYMEGIGLMIVQLNDIGKVSHYAKPVVVEMVERSPADFATPIFPTFDLSMQDAIGLMNTLWEAGVRPTEFKHPSGEIQRLEAHLEDMRKLAFKETA